MQVNHLAYVSLIFTHILALFCYLLTSEGNMYLQLLNVTKFTSYCLTASAAVYCGPGSVPWANQNVFLLKTAACCGWKQH